MIHIKRVNKINGASKNSHIISKGVHYDKDTNSFLFDFEHDNETDVIKLEQTDSNEATIELLNSYKYSEYFNI